MGMYWSVDLRNYNKFENLDFEGLAGNLKFGVLPGRGVCVVSLLMADATPTQPRKLQSQLIQLSICVFMLVQLLMEIILSLSLSLSAQWLPKASRCFQNLLCI